MATLSLAGWCFFVLSIAVVHARLCTDSEKRIHCQGSHWACYVNFNKYVCVCEQNRFGDSCQYYSCNDLHYCYNGGRCYTTTNGQDCLCSSNTFGPRCEYTHCHDTNYCYNGGTCYYNQGHHCLCTSSHVGPRCEHIKTTTKTTTTTTITTTATTTTTQPTTTAYISQLLQCEKSRDIKSVLTRVITGHNQCKQTRYIHCNKYSTVADLAHTAPVTNQNSSECVHLHSHASSEALVMHDCNATSPDTWKKGRKIVGNCASIPAYTAIGTFASDAFPIGQGLAGIFLECLPNGFKVAIQTCDHSSKIIHIETGGVGLLDPEMYFTI